VPSASWRPYEQFESMETTTRELLRSAVSATSKETLWHFDVVSHAHSSLRDRLVALESVMSAILNRIASSDDVLNSEEELRRLQPAFSQIEAALDDLEAQADSTTKLTDKICEHLISLTRLAERPTKNPSRPIFSADDLKHAPDLVTLHKRLSTGRFLGRAAWEGGEEER
jgi:hypothetical protein